MLIVATVLIFYLAIANLGAFFQLVAALRWSISLTTWDRREDYDRMLTADFTPPISFIVPTGALAGMEEAEHVDRLLSLRYPEFEVILVKDGSSEEITAVTGAFFMKRVDLRFRRVLETEKVLTLFRSDDAKLTLVEKEPGAWGDAVNCGLNLARYPLACILQPPALPHPENLLRMVRVGMETREPIFRSSGLVKAVNGPALEGLEPRQEHFPPGRMLRLFIAERLVAETGRAGGLRRAGLCPPPSKPLSIYRRQMLLSLGGFAAGMEREVAEADIYLRAYAKTHGEKGEMESFMLQGPASQGRLPESLGEQLARVRADSRRAEEALARRRRELRGVAPMLDRLFLAFRRLFLQPAAGVEVISYVVLIIATAAGALDPMILGVFFAVALGLPALISVISVMAVQASFPLHPGSGLPLMLYAVLSNLGYRQLMSISSALASLRWGR